MKHLKRIRKALFITFFVVPTIFIQAQSDTIYTGSITVTTQAEVDTLSTTLAGKTIIDGNLTIGYTLVRDSLSSSNITNLTPLSNIVHITGGVWIQQNGQLVNFTGLDSLQTIGGFFRVNSNAKLTTLGDFPALDSIGGDFLVFRNGELTTLGDFSALQSIGGKFHVSYNDQLRTLGDFLVLNSIEEDFEVFNNDQLTTLGDFPALDSIGGLFNVDNNPILRSIGDFPELQTIGGYFRVIRSGKLTTLGYFPGLQSIGGYFRVSNNDSLTTLGDFPALQSIGGYFQVSSNDKLTSLGDFPVLDSIGGYFDVSFNDQLTSLGDFSALDSIGRYFNVNNNDQLTTLGDFPVLQSIGGYFNVGSNDQLTSLGDFPALQTIGGYFDVLFNDKLFSIGSFSNLTSVGIGRVYVPSLGETTDSVSIVVEYNTNLVLCSWLESFLPTGSNAVTGGIYVQNNATGCATTEEINNRLPVLIAENHLFTYKDSTTTSFNIYANVRWKLVASDDATWITSLSSDSSTHTSRITGENEATITLIHTRAPNETPRSTTLTLTAINEDGDELMNLATVTINFIQLSTFYEGGIILSSQAEVDEFISNTAAILGNLTIGYTSGSSRSNITDLTPLSNIVHITGGVWIQQNKQLVNLNALNNLQTIGGFFQVNNNDSLTTLGDFPNLQSIGGNFAVFNNDKLTTLGDFTALQTIGGNFTVFSNDKLTTLGDFTALQSIGGNFSVSFDDQLTTLGNFPALQSIGGNFSVSNNDTLTTLGDFTALQTIGEYFSVGSNDRLTSLGNFSALDSIGGDFRVSSNDVLETLGNFSVLDSIGGYFRVFNNDQLTSLGDFPALQTIGEYFTVSFNDRLRTLGDFPNLTSIGIGRSWVPSLSESRDSVSIVVEYNTNLVLCSWLEDFLPTETHAVTGDIYINNNATGCATTEEIKNPPPVLVVKNPIFAHKDSTTTSFNIYANVRWQLATSDNATWITSLSSGSSTHSSRITGENETTITLMHTRAPNETPRSTTFTLTPINEEGEELTNPATMTIHFTQLSTFYEGDIILSSQAEVDEFISNTTVILGNLTIGYTDYGDSRSNITDLTPLSNINQITGYVWIRQNGQLDNINALNNLQTIGGYFSMNSNDTLTTIGDFSSLQSIGEYFSVSTNAKLTTLGNFPALQSIGEFFVVRDNDTLTTLGYFPVLQSIGGDFNVSSNAKLTTIGDFPTLQTVEEGFYVTDNDSLTTLGNFPNLTSIGTSSSYVPSLDERRDTVSIVVENNSRLSDCCLLASFLEQDNIGHIFITNNATGCDRDTIQNTCHTLIVTTNKNHQIAYDSTNSIPISFMVGGSATGWTSAITYTPADASFITLSPTEGTDITTAITLMATPTENTGVEKRTAMITLTTTGIMGTPATQTIVITQQSPPTIMLSTSNQTIAYNSTDPIGISFMVGGSATGWKSAITYTPANANFITLDTNMNDNQTGAITLMATPTENTGVERTATITLTTTGMGAPVSVSLTITQEVRAALSTHTKESIFIFYPNPTKGKLTVEGVTGYLQMYIHDLVGREVMTYSLTPSKKTIDVSNLPSGMYVVTVQAENKTWTEVLVIDN